MTCHFGHYNCFYIYIKGVCDYYASASDVLKLGCSRSISGSGRIYGELGGSGLVPDTAGSEVESSKYWQDLHNYDIKHPSIFSFQEMTHDNIELYTITH